MLKSIIILLITNQFQFVILVDGVDELDIQNLDVRSGKPPSVLYFHAIILLNSDDILM